MQSPNNHIIKNQGSVLLSMLVIFTLCMHLTLMTTWSSILQLRALAAQNQKEQSLHRAEQILTYVVDHITVSKIKNKSNIKPPIPNNLTWWQNNAIRFQNPLDHTAAESYYIIEHIKQNSKNPLEPYLFRIHVYHQSKKSFATTRLTALFRYDPLSKKIERLNWRQLY